MKLLATLSAAALLVCFAQNVFSYSVTFSVDASTKTAVGWQGAATTLSNAFAGNTMPTETILYIWDASSQNWTIITHSFGSWDNPNYTLNPTQGFLVECPGDGGTFTLNGNDLTGTVFTVNLTANNWYLLAYAYPREGWLEKNPAPYAVTCNLNFPGADAANNGGVEDEYHRWRNGTQWVFTRRGNDTNNKGGEICVDLTTCPPGGYDKDCCRGSRWFKEGMTTEWQGNGVAENWIYVGQPIFFKPLSDRTWNMYSDQADCP